MNALMLSVCTSLGDGISKPTFNGETNKTYLLQSYLEPSYSKEEISPGKFSASPMSSGERKKGDDTNNKSE